MQISVHDLLDTPEASLPDCFEDLIVLLYFFLLSRCEIFYIDWVFRIE